MAEYIELSQAITLFGDVDARFDTVEGKIPSNASSGNKMVTASDIATKADLVDGKVPSSQLPSYVDDVLEYASTSQFPATGESGKIYVATDTNKTYRWGGSDYVEISESLALGETSSTAYAGDKGKANADAISAIEELIPSNATSSNKLATASDIPTVPTKTSDLTNDSNFVADASYVHTDNNYDATAKSTVDSIPLTISQLQGSLLNKVDKETGKGLSTNDYTTADQTALQTTIPLEISQLQASLLTKANASDIPDISGLQPKNLSTTIGSYTTVEGALSGINDGKVDKVTGKGLSTNDYDATAKGKVDDMDASIAASQNGSMALTKATVGWTGKNKLHVLDSVATKIINGITFTVNKNSDGEVTSVVANGTASGGVASLDILYGAPSVFSFLETGKEYVLCGCPANGSVETYELQIYLDPWSTTDRVRDFGEGAKFTMFSLVGVSNVYLAITIREGQTVSNLTFYPMICDANIADLSFEPYHKNVSSTISSTVESTLIEEKVIDGKNLFPVPQNVTSKTTGGITFTVNKNADNEVESIVLNGTSNDIVYFDLDENFDTTKYAGCKFVGYADSINHVVTDYAAYRISSADSRVGLQDLTLNGQIISNNGTNRRLAIRVPHGLTLSNYALYPMICSASETNYDFEPYYTSLKKSINSLQETKLSTSDLKTVVAASSDFADFQTRIAAL